MGAFESGKSLAEQLLAKLPESLRGQAKAVFDAAEAAEALTLLGDSALARGDYSRQSDEIRRKGEELAAQKAEMDAIYAQQTDWWNANGTKAQEYDRLKPEYDRLKAGGVVPPKKEDPPPASGLTEEQVAKMLEQRDMGSLSVLSLANTLSIQHYRDFNEVLDLGALIAHAQKNGVALYNPKAETDAYRSVHAEKLAAKAQAAHKALIDKEVGERLAAERRTQQGPYPVRGQEPSVLDALEQPDRQNRYTVDSAVARYEELTSGAAARG